MKVGFRRLPLTGRKVIEFHWSLKYTGLRHPLIIQRPSLTDGYMNTTFAHIYAFPPHSDKGRKVTFTVQRDPNEELKYAFTGPPADWYLVVEKGKTETGTEYVFIEELKEKLLSLYPAEYAADKPPKLYAELVHNAWDRGYHGHLDAWTGEVGQQDYFELPDLAAW